MENKSVLRVICHQQIASYTKPRTTGGRVESYILPPPSTVIGMVHAACGFTEYIPMDVSIQGYVGDMGRDLQRKIMTMCFKKQGAWKKGSKMEATRYNLGWKDLEGVLRGLITTVARVEVVQDITLVLHISADKEAMKLIERGLRYPKTYLNLGRHEDMLNILSIEEVEISEGEIAEPTDVAYIGVDKSAELLGVNAGTRLKLSKVYSIRKTNGVNIREWEMVDVVQGSNCMGYTSVDSDGYGVYLV